MFCHFYSHEVALITALACVWLPSLFAIHQRHLRHLPAFFNSLSSSAYHGFGDPWAQIDHSDTIWFKVTVTLSFQAAIKTSARPCSKPSRATPSFVCNPIRLINHLGWANLVGSPGSDLTMTEEKSVSPPFSARKIKPGVWSLLCFNPWIIWDRYMNIRVAMNSQLIQILPPRKVSWSSSSS